MVRVRWLVQAAGTVQRLGTGFASALRFGNGLRRAGVAIRPRASTRSRQPGGGRSMRRQRGTVTLMDGAASRPDRSFHYNSIGSGIDPGRRTAMKGVQGSGNKGHGPAGDAIAR